MRASRCSRPRSRHAGSLLSTSRGSSGAARRDAEKELAAIDRRLAKLADAIRSTHDEFAAHDQSDYAGLGALQAKLSELESEAADARGALARAQRAAGRLSGG